MSSGEWIEIHSCKFTSSQPLVKSESSRDEEQKQMDFKKEFKER